MNRKDYGAIAETIRQQRCISLRSDDSGRIKEHVNAHIDDIVEELVTYFVSQSAKFDAARFRKAAGKVVD